MKSLLIGSLMLMGISDYANASLLGCYGSQSQKAVTLIEKVNGYENAKAVMIGLKSQEVTVLATVEAYTGIGGALYEVTMDGCKVINVEMIEEIDRD